MSKLSHGSGLSGNAVLVTVASVQTFMSESSLGSVHSHKERACLGRDPRDMVFSQTSLKKFSTPPPTTMQVNGLGTCQGFRTMMIIGQSHSGALASRRGQAAGAVFLQARWTGRVLCVCGNPDSTRVARAAHPRSGAHAFTWVQGRGQHAPKTF